jgi:APA family basic amino acid/polyamine antiporter
LATYALGFADYAAELAPGINTPLIAAIAMICCYVANLLGVQVAARFQLVMVALLIFSLISFVVVGLTYVGDFSVYNKPDTVMPAGVGTFISAAFLLRYGMVGSEFISELGGESVNPGRNIPLVMMTCLAFVTVLYVGVAIVATGVLPLDAVQGQSLAFVAKEIFPRWFYLFFVIGGVMLALISSLNAIFSWCTKGLYIAAHDGWISERLAVTNRFGTPYILLSVFFVVGMLPIVTGTTLEYVTILGNAVGIVFGIIPALALYNLNTRRPEAYAAASFKLPVSLMKTLPLIALAIYGYGVYLSSIDFISRDHLIAFAIYAAAVVIYAKWREPTVIQKLSAKIK